MNNQRIYTTILLIFFFNSLFASIPERKGWWKFDNPTDLLEAEKNYPATLELVGIHTGVNGPNDTNGAVSIGIGSHYKMQHLINANGGGTLVNEYTLQFDFSVPSISKWYAFFQTNSTNSNDADFFINPSGNIGVAAVGYSGFTIKPNEWYRLLIAIKNPSQFVVYLDGKMLFAGNPQLLDDRFALDQWLLVFADEDGEDGEIRCAELSIWDQCLTDEQARELGGFGHVVESSNMSLIPYLQSPGTTSMVVNWHDTLPNTQTLLFGTTPELGNQHTAISEQIKWGYYWNTANLEGLTPQTNYYYRLTNGMDTSDTFIFKTLPDTTYQGKLRFLILGDTHASDTTMSQKILKEAKNKLVQLYGINFQDSVQAIIHSGDLVVSGSSIDHYSIQYFSPMATLSGNIATMAVAGNHEGENPYFYQYMKLDRYSAFPDNPNLNEKVWRFRVGNVLYLGLNTNITANYGTTMTNWLDKELNAAEYNASIDFVFLVFHHPPFSELWYDAITFDAGPNYIRNAFFPVIKKYSKVQQIHYGHTHGFERGTILSDIPDADFRIICGGGSGGPLDPWNEPAVHDYHEIHKTLSEYFFQIVEVDISGKWYENTVYSLGDLVNPKQSLLLDRWYKKKNQPKPVTPLIENISKSGQVIKVQLSKYSGSDSLMTVQLQFSDESINNKVVVDTMIHWQNIFGVDALGHPVDNNLGINLESIQIPIKNFPSTKNLICKVRYRDHNLKWSEWSSIYMFEMVGINENPSGHSGYFLGQNYPNPFNKTTQINYQVPECGNVRFQFLNQQYQIVASIDEGVKEKGIHFFIFNNQQLESGMYFYQLIANKKVLTREMIKVQ